MAQEVGSRSLHSLDPTSCFPQTHSSKCFVWCYGPEFVAKDATTLTEMRCSLGPRRKPTIAPFAPERIHSDRFYLQLPSSVSKQRFKHSTIYLPEWVARDAVY